MNSKTYVVVGVWMVLACASPIQPSRPDPPPSVPAPSAVPVIEYRVLGAGIVDVTYQDEWGHWIVSPNQGLPWTYTQSRLWGMAYLEVVRRGPECVTAQIWRGGVQQDHYALCPPEWQIVLSKGWY